MMEWERWKPLYEKILKEFEYDEKKDREAAIIANELANGLKRAGVEKLKSMIQFKPVTICGAAMRKEDIARARGVVIAADEATSLLMVHGKIPDIIVTDLDGNMEDILEANKKKSIAVVHAHGDNIEALKKWLPKFEGYVAITTQTEPFDGVYNFGGFTDGDRAYCMARHFHACQIFLIGFDFENVVEKEGKDATIKARKLKWAERIIKWYDML